MTNYLMTKSKTLPFVASSYTNTFKIKDTDFHINKQAVKTHTGVVSSSFLFGKSTVIGGVSCNVPKDCETIYKLTSDSDIDEFEKFYSAWHNNTAYLYRGIAGCHFSWDRVKGLELKSEGDSDIPTFTMGGSTRWLPGDFSDTVPASIAMGNCDAYTAELTKNVAVPMGAVLKIKVGRTVGVPVAYLNAGEIVVRGPLSWPKFDVHCLVWLTPKQVAKTPWPGGLPPKHLMPLRPYQPDAKEKIEAWWGVDMKKWFLDKDGAIPMVT